MLGTAESQWDVVWHKLSPETRAAFPSFQSALGHRSCLGQPGLVGQRFGLSAVRCSLGEGCGARSSAAPVPSRRDSWRHLLPCFHSPSECWEDQRAAPPLACSALGTCWILQESRGVAERTRTEEGREEALEM